MGKRRPRTRNRRPAPAPAASRPGRPAPAPSRAAATGRPAANRRPAPPRPGARRRAWPGAGSDAGRRRWPVLPPGGGRVRTGRPRQGPAAARRCGVSTRPCCWRRSSRRRPRRSALAVAWPPDVAGRRPLCGCSVPYSVPFSATRKRSTRVDTEHGSGRKLKAIRARFCRMRGAGKGPASARPAIWNGDVLSISRGLSCWGHANRELCTAVHVKGRFFLPRSAKWVVSAASTRGCWPIEDLRSGGDFRVLHWMLTHARPLQNVLTERGETARMEARNGGKREPPGAVALGGCCQLAGLVDSLRIKRLPDRDTPRTLFSFARAELTALQRSRTS